jgi:A/G-specific adenine glycosylase
MTMTDAHRLVTWFHANARPLPWRTTPRDPYRSLVSELMAQQTRMERVVPRFELFIRRFPTLGDLAAASRDEVLEAWSGLGYYRRARLLHRLAREVVAGNGELPTTAAELEKLPGIGPYTAAAVASIVFGESIPLMDGNVGRVGARVLALAEDPRKARGKAVILEWVSQMMSHAPPGEVNEALMELGARVCTSSQPACESCPMAPVCRSHIEGDPTAYPPPRQTRETIDVRWLAVIVQDQDGRWLLREVTEGPILRGLWLPPFTEIDDSRLLEEQVWELIPFQASGFVEFSKPIRHSITHRRIEVTPARFVVDHPVSVSMGWSWADPATPNLPTSSLLGKLFKSVSTSPSTSFLPGREAPGQK